MVKNYTLPNATAGIDGAIADVASQIPIFIPMFLAFVWFVVFLGGYGYQKRQLGTADAPIWAVMASLSTFMISLTLSLGTGIISLQMLSFTVGILILSAIWLFLSKGRGEL